MAKAANLKPFQPGQSGNPAGRKVGSRSKLGEAFLEALCEDFATHGREAIERVRVEKPEAYLKVISSILPKQFDISAGPLEGMSDDELAAMIKASEVAIRDFMATADGVAEDEEDRLH